MIEDRIGELRLRIRTDGDGAAVRPAAERLVRDALERCAALLEQRAPGRVVLMRSLPLRWRIDESLLADAAGADELARWAADAVERGAVPYSLVPPEGHDGAVVFDDEPQFRAARLLALARGGPAWFPAGRGEDGEDPLAALAVPERRAVAEATLLRLARDGVLAEVLAAQPAPAVAVLAAALGCSPAPPERDAAGPPDTRAAADLPVGRWVAVASDWPPLSAPARRLALRAHAAVLLDSGFAAPETLALAAALSSRPFALSASGGEPAGRSPPATEARVPPPEDRGRPPEDSKGPPAEPAEPEAISGYTVTRCAGLFYLLDRVQELDLAESLWKACLPEGEVLAAAAAALLGRDFAGDIAPALFGGLETRYEPERPEQAPGAVEGPFVCPEVAPEQHEEVAAATLAALAAALPRRGLAELPPVFLALADHPAGRLLTAAAAGSPFACFAWPATAPEGIEAGLRAFLGHWPHRGEVFAGPALAALDGSGRLRPSPEVRPQRLLLPGAAAAPAAALLALAAGAPCLLLAARAGARPFAAAEDFVARYLARAARLRLASDRIDILLGAEDIDFDLRRAGLDRDPGWLPWLGRELRFVYEARDTGGDSAAGGDLL